jgi:hypothetical protein
MVTEHCEHEFEHSRRSPFSDTQGARICRICERIEVLSNQHWIDFEEYLEYRWAEPMAAG